MKAPQHWGNHLPDLGENIFACFGNHWAFRHNWTFSNRELLNGQMRYIIAGLGRVFGNTSDLVIVVLAPWGVEVFGGERGARATRAGPHFRSISTTYLPIR